MVILIADDVYRIVSKAGCCVFVVISTNVGRGAKNICSCSTIISFLYQEVRREESGVPFRKESDKSLIR